MYYDSRIFCYLCTRIKDKTTMDKMKVISIRMTEKELTEIDNELVPYRYYKRSDFIRAAVQVLLNANNGAGTGQDIAKHRAIVHKSLYMPYGYNTGLNVNLEIEHYDKRTKRNQK